MLARTGVLLTLTALALAGCTSPERTDQPPVGAPPGDAEDPGNGEVRDDGAVEVVDAHAVDNEFQPAEIPVEQGARLRVTNLGAVLHSVTILKDGGFLATEDRDLQPGENVVVDLPEPGLYKLRCRYHSTGFDTAGEMVGRVTVG